MICAKNHANRVVVTGMGILSPLGNTVNEFYTRMADIRYSREHFSEQTMCGYRSQACIS